MLPDKKRESYDALFSMLKECLSRRGLSLSAQYFMSDFELNIKNSFMSFFPDTECKGCLFHFAKAVVGQVNKRGFKQEFSDVRKNSKLGRKIKQHPIIFVENSRLNWRRVNWMQWQQKLGTQIVIRM